MEKYFEVYNKSLDSQRSLKRNIMDSVVMLFKAVNIDPVLIGNMVYYYVNHNGIDVPAYAYFRDYQTGDFNWLPIYDEENTAEFGWSDFSNCCRIFDMIRQNILKQ